MIKIIHKRARPLAVIGNEIILWHYGSLIVSSETDCRVLCRLPVKRWKLLISKLRIFERIFRIEPHNICVAKNLIYVAVSGAVYSVDLFSGEMRCEHLLRKGMSRPLSIIHISDINGFENCIAYGEYWQNTKSGEVAIFAKPENSNEWKEVHVFKSGLINHIHNIVPDKHRNCVYILTGDKNSESGIWIAHDNFHVVEPLLIGSQKYRSCVAFSIADGLIYATDMPNSQNSIFILKILNDSVITHSKIIDICGSCISGAKAKDKFYFSTTVEPDSTITGLRYYFTYRLGIGIQKREIELIEINAINYKSSVLWKGKKDNWPMTLCQFGSVSVVPKNENQLLLYPVAISKYDGCLCCLDIESENRTNGNS